MSVQPRLVKVEEEGKEFDNLLLKTLSKYFVEKEQSFFFFYSHFVGNENLGKVNLQILVEITFGMKNVTFITSYIYLHSFYVINLRLGKILEL